MGSINDKEINKYIRNGCEWVQKYLKYLVRDISRRQILVHHGIKGQKWGVRNGPPYPIDKSKKRDTIVKDAIASGKVSKKINREKQLRNTKEEHLPGRSYLDGDLDYAQKLVDELSGTGKQ